METGRQTEMVRDGDTVVTEQKEEKRISKRRINSKQILTEPSRNPRNDNGFNNSQGNFKNKAGELLQQLPRSIKKLNWLIQYGIGNKRN